MPGPKLILSALLTVTALGMGGCALHTYGETASNQGLHKGRCEYITGSRVCRTDEQPETTSALNGPGVYTGSPRGGSGAGN